jgi:ABC-type phosphate/phosphonate transport system ATPase subunit
MELRIRGISKTYPNGVQALKDVTLTIPTGMYGGRRQYRTDKD